MAASRWVSPNDSRNSTRSGTTLRLGSPCIRHVHLLARSRRRAVDHLTAVIDDARHTCHLGRHCRSRYPPSARDDVRVGGRQVHGGQPIRLVHPPNLQLAECPRRSIGHVAVPAWADRTQLQPAPASKTRQPTTPSLSPRQTPTTTKWHQSATCMYTRRTVRAPLPTPVVTHASQCRLTYPVRPLRFPSQPSTPSPSQRKGGALKPISIGRPQP